MPERQGSFKLIDKKIPNFLTWIEHKHPVSQKETVRSFPHLGATDCGLWIKQKLIELIKSAQKKVFLSSFIMDYPEIEETLMEASKRLKGHVYVLSPLDKSIFKDPKFIDRLSEDERGSLSEKQEERVKELSRAGVYIREHTNCHAKFCVMDTSSALIMTSNLTKRSMEENPEIGILINDKKNVAELDRLFQILWTQGATRESIPDKNRPDIRSIPQKSTKKEFASFLPSDNLCWTHHHRHLILDEIVRLIQSAEETLKIASYLIRELHQKKNRATYNLLSGLKEAVQRGVKVEIVVHAPPGRMRGSDLRENERKTLLEMLTIGNKNNVSIFGHPKVHSKYVIKDQKEAVLFTANIDGVFGLDNGIEVGYKISDQVDLVWLTNYHRKLMSESKLLLVYEPQLSHLLERKDAKSLLVRKIIAEKKNQASAEDWYDKLGKVLTSSCLWWTSPDDSPETVYLCGWGTTELTLQISPLNKKQGEWHLESILTKRPGEIAASSKEKRLYRKGFVDPAEISVVTRWKYAITDLMKMVNTKISSELATKEPVPLSVITPTWVGVGSKEMPFDDNEEEWLKKLRNYLYDADLERKDGHWLIRQPIGDEEILEVINGARNEDKIDIEAVMKEFKERGWNVPGKTTGTKKMREFFQEKMGVRVKKDGSIEQINEI